MRTIDMLGTHPSVGPAGRPGLETGLVVECIDACAECAQACTTCADACLASAEAADLVGCIRTNLDCADLCVTTERIVSRVSGPLSTEERQVLEACAAVCGNCAAICETHAGDHDHCRVCAEACRRCEEACRELATAGSTAA